MNHDDGPVRALERARRAARIEYPEAAVRVNPEVTLGGYMAKHERAAAFAGCDGHPYSCAILTDDEPDFQGRFGAALLFIRWDGRGEHPAGHVETGYLAWGASREEAEQRIGALSLWDVKAALDDAIRNRPEGW